MPTGIGKFGQAVVANADNTVKGGLFPVPSVARDHMGRVANKSQASEEYTWAENNWVSARKYQ